MVLSMLTSFGKNICMSNKSLFSYINMRQLVFHKSKRIIGHKLEFITGKHRSMKLNPPRIPIHPVEDSSKNMNLFETYRDLRLRWKKSTTSRRKRLRIARKWRMPNNIFPLDEPTCIFVRHSNLPFTRKKSSYLQLSDKDNQDSIPELNNIFQENNNNQKEWPMYPPNDIQNELSLGKLPLFCVFKSGPHYQHKVTVGDLVQAERLHRKSAGDKVTFGTVLLVGSRDWTIIGKPTVPYAKVNATIEQQTLCGEQISFYYRKKNRTSKFRRIMHYVTILRIDEIVIDVNYNKTNNDLIKPKRLLDLWANRWLYNHELQNLHQIKDDDDDSELHKSLQHNYHKKGISESYRWFPDPLTKHRNL